MIEALIAEELARANTIHRDHFVSMHEGESVIREEIEEAEEELNYIRMLYKALWNQIKKRDDREAIDTAKTMKIYVMSAINELTQVAAMCDKFAESFKEGEQC